MVQGCTLDNSEFKLLPFNAVKEEPLCDDTTGIKVPRPQLKKAFLIPNQPTVAELFQKMSVSSEDELLFIQLPDTIPGQPSAHSDKLAKKEPKAEDKQTPSKSQVSLFICGSFSSFETYIPYIYVQFE